MYRLRRKRAAPKDIYPSCKISNTCPPDIQNKIEHTTIADKILQYGSLGVFLGGLGIGTARGSGGRIGYTPLGEGGGVRVATRPTPVRPTIPVETVGPSEIFPIDVVDPTGPAVIPLQDLGRDFPIPTVQVIAEIHPISDIPNIVASSTNEGQSAILDVLQGSATIRTVSRTQYNNPSFTVASTSNISAGEASTSDIVFVSNGSGDRVVGEDIPLVELNLGLETDTSSVVQETAFSSSTPIAERPSFRPSRFYNRRLYEQVQVQDPRFVEQPQSMVTFDNPAFEPELDEVSIIFQRDLDALAQTPVPEFRDVVYLSKPTFSREPGGRLRVSRLGKSSTIRTRLGTAIGARTHFFYDLSSIAPEDSIELLPLGEHSQTTVISSNLGDTAFIQGETAEDDLEVISLETPQLYSEEELLDTNESVGENLQLTITNSEGEVSILDLTQSRVRPPFGTEDTSLHVYYPNSSKGTPIINPEESFTPLVIIALNNSTGDFELHPSLRKRRKRAYV